MHVPIVHWRMNLRHGMYDDPVASCASCDYEVYTNGLAVFLMRLFGRMSWKAVR